MLKLGYSEVDITPSGFVETVGFNRKDNMSRGVLKALLAQVAVWETENVYCLITIDSIGFKKALTDNLRNMVCRALNTSIDKVMISFSHCHSAPNAGVETDYYELVCRKIEESAKNAMRQLHKVYTGCGNAYVDIGVNRREGNISTDKRVGILKVCNADKEGKTELIILRLTAHCNALKRDNYMISPDFFGDIRDVMEGHYNCPIMIIQGAAGNIAPKYFNSKETPVDALGEKYIRSENALQDIAQEVLKQSAPIIEKIQVESEADILMYSKNIVLYAHVPDYETACKIAKEAKTECGIDGENWLREVKKLNDCGIKTQEENVEVQYFKIGNMCLCGVPYEIMVEFAIGAEQALKDEFFYFNGYTNGCLSYFPTEDEFDRGGYEVWWSLLIYYSYFNRVFPFMRESAAKLLDFAVGNAPKKYLIVKKHIDEMDYCSLLSTGAPDNEFDSESREISNKINNAHTEQDIARIIAKVFNATFGNKDAEDCFIDCAKKIHVDLHL